MRDRIAEVLSRLFSRRYDAKITIKFKEDTKNVNCTSGSITKK